MADVFATDSATASDGVGLFALNEGFDAYASGATSLDSLTLSAVWSVSTTRYQSSPNALGTSSGFSGLYFCTGTTHEYNARIAAKFYLENSDQDNAFGLVSRGTSTPLGSAVGYYAAEVRNNAYSTSDWTVSLNYYNNPTTTALDSLTVSGTVHSGWYELTLDALGSDLSVTLERLSDGYCLDSSGSWSSSRSACLTATNGSLFNPGHSGFYAWGAASHGSPVYCDDFRIRALPEAGTTPESAVSTMYATETPEVLESGTAFEYIIRVYSYDPATFSDGLAPSNSLSYSQNWDGVTAPSISISGWTINSGIVTSTTHSRSASNSLAILNPHGGYHHATYGTADGTGDVQVSSSFWLDDGDRDVAFGLVLRGSSSSLNHTSTTYYQLEAISNDFSASDWSLVLSKVVSGTKTALSTVGPIAGAITLEWFVLTFKALGTGLTGKLQRVSDSKYLNSSGSWVTGDTTAISITDSSITGSGYAGLYFWGQGTTQGSSAWSDDFALTGLAASPTPETASPILVSVDASASSSETARWTSTALASDTVDAANFGGSTHSAFTTDSSGSLTDQGIDVTLLLFAYGTDEITSTEILDSLIGSVLSLETPTTFEAARFAGSLFGTDTGTGDAFSAITLVLASLDSITVSEDEWSVFSSGLTYRIYANDGLGGPIDYTTPVDTVSDLTWTSAALAYPGTWKFGVRVYDAGSTLEEKNLDASVELVLDASGNDITNWPKPPVGLRAFGLEGGRVRIEWTYPYGRASTPTGFHVYKGTGGTPDYGTVAATVPWILFSSSYTAELGPLTDGTTYTIGVRAYSGSSEETNAVTVDITADATGPDGVDDLTATATGESD